jgi:hypothetical protein
MNLRKVGLISQITAATYFIILAIIIFIFRKWLFSLNFLEIILLCVLAGGLGGFIWGIPKWIIVFKARRDRTRNRQELW